MAKIIYLGEERIVDIHHQGHEHAEENKEECDEKGPNSSSDSEQSINIETKAGMIKTYRRVQKEVNYISNQDRLLKKFKSTFGDIGEDLEADFGDLDIN